MYISRECKTPYVILRQEYLDGAAIKDIAKRHHCSATTLSARIKGDPEAHDVFLSLRCKTPYNVLKQAYIDGMSVDAIAIKYRCSRRLLSARLKKDGLSVLQYNKKYEHNDTFFDVIDTEEKAYWLGFLYADGCCHSKDYIVSLALQARDKEHILLLMALISPDNRVVYHPKTVSYTLSVCSKRLHTALVNLGCTPRKSLTLTFPTTEQLPVELRRHFIRGYFDGDGTVHYSVERKVLSISLLGTHAFLASIRDEWVNNVAGYTATTIAKKLNNEANVMQKNTNKQITELYKYLYTGASTFLDRKYKIFSQLPSIAVMQ